jgi:hypothetical protein
VSRRASALIAVAAVIAAATALGACGDSGGSTATATTLAPSVASTATTAAPTTAAPSTTAASSSAAPTLGIVNTWSGATVDPKKLPLGDSKVSTTTATRGGLFACSAGRPNGQGAQVAGPWIDTAAGTWDSTRKVRVQGAVSWPSADYRETVTAAGRVLVTNDLPVKIQSGTFPIATNDPAYAYDRNPNSIKTQSFTVTLPMSPKVTATPTCLSMGAIGMLRNGVVLFASLDERNRDAVAYETQDLCDGHPQQSGAYHYHDIPSCLRDAAVGSSTVVGFAYDGFPIVVERDAAGRLPTNADLDECHGRTSPVALDGAVVTTYHYAATLEFPYMIGCRRGSA